uniref:Uncharacterized protein n=1 Tax=Timema tahoe TaxID=61484 RepID=A0A7R9ILK1_9NEOP|nr:unnamed protein product [Timema tahoe]
MAFEKVRRCKLQRKILVESRFFKMVDQYLNGISEEEWIVENPNKSRNNMEGIACIIPSKTHKLLQVAQ